MPKSLQRVTCASALTVALLALWVVLTTPATYFVDVTVVTEADFRPVGGAAVSLATSGLDPLCRETGADGRARFVTTCSATFEMQVSSPGFQTRQMEVQVGDRSGAPVLFGRRLDLAVSLPRGGEITGRIQTPDGLPIAGAKVEMASCTNLLFFHWSTRVRVEDVVSDAEGRFVLRGLPPVRDVVLRTSHPAWESRESWVTEAGPEVSPAETRIVLRPRSEPELVEKWEQSPAWTEWLSGVVTARSGEPLDDVLVASNYRRSSPARTDSGGRFHVKTRRGKEVSYKFTRPGFLPRTVSGRSGEELAVVLEPAAVLDVQLAPPVAGGGPSLWCPPFSANVYPADRAADSEGRHDQRVLHDPRGRYRVELRGGTLEASFRVPGFLPVARKVELVAGEDVALRIALERGRTVHGRVVRSEDGAPVRRAKVVLQRADDSPRFLEPDANGCYVKSDAAHASTAEDGRFAITGVPGDRFRDWQIWVRAPGRAVSRSKVFSAAGLGEPLVISMPPEARVNGRIVGWSAPESVRIRTKESIIPYSYSASATLDLDERVEATLAEVLAPRRALAGSLIERHVVSRSVAVMNDGTFTIGELPGGYYSFSFLSTDADFVLEPGEIIDLPVDVSGGWIAGPLRLPPGCEWEPYAPSPFCWNPGEPKYGQQILTLRESVGEDDGEDYYEIIRYVDAFVGETETEVGLGRSAVRVTVSIDETPPELDKWRLSLLGVEAAEGISRRLIPRAEVSYYGESQERVVEIGRLPAGRYVAHLGAPRPCTSPTSAAFELRDGDVAEITLDSHTSDEWTLPQFTVSPSGTPPWFDFLWPLRASTIGEKDRPPGRSFALVNSEYGRGDFATAPVDVTFPLASPLSVRLQSPGGLRVHVVETDGTPAARARVALFHPFGLDLLQLNGIYLPAHTDAKGRLVLGPLAPGDYELEAYYKDASSPPLSCTVRAGVTDDVRLVLSRG